MSSRQLISFEIEGLRFGLDILLVREINNRLELTPVHDVADHVVGVANLRGQVLTILDIGRRLGLPPRSSGAEPRVIVFKTESELRTHRKSGALEDGSSDDMVGVLVDRVADVIKFEPSDLHPVPANFDQVENRFVEGVLTRENGLVVILRLEPLLSPEAEGALR